MNHKSCVHQISEIGLMKQVQLSCERDHIRVEVRSGGLVM